MSVVVHNSGAGDIGRVTVNNSTSNNTMAYNAPANVAEGDLLILFGSCNDALNPSSLTLDDGWVLINNNFSANGSFRVHVAYAYMNWTASEGTSWLASIGASTSDDDWFVRRFSGHDPASPIAVAAAAFSDNSSVSPICPSITTPVDDCLAIYAMATKNGTALAAEDTGAPSGTTLLFSKKSRNFSAGVNTAVAYEQRNTAGATGTRTWTNYLTGAQYWAAYSFAIRAASLVPAILTVEGSATPELPDESISVDVVTQDMDTIASGTLDGRAVSINSTGADTCNIDFPSRVDGMTWGNLPDTKELELEDTGAVTASIDVDITLQDGEVSTTIASADTSGPGPLAYYLDQLGYSVADGVELYYQGLDGDVVINPDTSVVLAGTAVPPFTMVFWHIDLGGEWNSFEVTFEEENPPTPGGVRNDIIRLEVVRMETLDFRLIAAESIN